MGGRGMEWEWGRQTDERVREERETERYREKGKAQQRTIDKERCVSEITQSLRDREEHKTQCQEYNG